MSLYNLSGLSFNDMQPSDINSCNHFLS